jgi:hypothetical protein
MQTIRTATIALGGVLTAFAALAACGGGAPQNEPVMTVEEFEKNTPEPGPWEDPCTDDKGGSLECGSDDDCCEGYSCLEDPGKSRVLKYCQQI